MGVHVPVVYMLSSIGQVFKVKAPQYFNDYHLIRSLIYKPTYSHFSRIERLTCVFAGLLAHMALCTLYYYNEVKVSVRIGPACALAT